MTNDPPRKPEGRMQNAKLPQRVPQRSTLATRQRSWLFGIRPLAFLGGSLVGHWRLVIHRFRLL